MAKAKEETSFEKNLESLEAIVSALEEGGLSLDDALTQFESGITLARRCEKALSEAEKKIEILTQNGDGTLEAEPFDEDDPPAAPAVSAPVPAKPTPAAAPRRVSTVSSEPEPTPDPDEEDLLF